MAALCLIELALWVASWSAGFAPLPLVFIYLALGFAGLGVALIVRLTLRRGAAPPNGFAAIMATVLVSIAASFFLPLKVAIPHQVPFWVDLPLASAERLLFAGDPWRLLDRLLGWALVPIDRVYGLWLPVQSLILFLVILEPPSRPKSRALIAYGIAWLLLGVVAAAIFSSAGPLFYDRIFGGDAFHSLGSTLRAKGASVALAESNIMWTAMASGRPGLVAGISAFPSMHVAISVWMALAARALAPRLAPVAVFYALFIWIASVQLGWHYASDGAAGALGMVAIWFAAGPVERFLRRRFVASPPAQPKRA